MTFKGVIKQGVEIIRHSTAAPTSSRYRRRQLTAEARYHAMGKKRASLAAGSVSGFIEKSKKGKKRRRESAPGSATGTSRADSSSGGPEKRKPQSSSSSSSSSSKEVVLRCAPKDSVSPIVVSFANQTVPNNMSALTFAVHQGEDEARLGQRVILGEGPRYV